MALVSNTMKTRITIDTLRAVDSLKTLKQAVNGATNEWKAQEVAYKSVGNYMQAAIARQDGLTTAIERQRVAIENQKKGLSDLGTITEKNAGSAARYENEIARMELKLNSMVAQQDRAKTAVERQIAGIDGLTAKMKSNDAATESYIRNLKSQGDEESAVNAKRKATTEQLKNQEEMYQRQETLLKQVARESGYTSEAYQKQRIALQDAGSAINETKQKLEKLNKEQEEAVKTTQTRKLGLDKLRESMKLSDDVSNAYLSALETESSRISKLGGKQSELVRSRERAATSLKAESELLERIGSKLGTSSNAYQEQKIKVLEAQGAYNKYNNELKETRVELAKVSPYGINQMTKATEKLRGAAGQVRGAFSDAFSGIGTLARGATTALAGVGVGVGASIKFAASLQDNYIRTMNLMKTGGETAAESQKNMNKMLKDGRTYSVDYGVEQSKIADGYQELVKRGYSGAQAIGSMKSMLQASVASGDDFNTVVHAATATLESFGMKANDVAGMSRNTSEAVNKMAYVADATATDFKGMGVALEYAGATAHTIGVPLSETSAMIGVLSNNGLEAQKSGTGLRKVLNSLTSNLSTAGDSTDKTAEKTKKYQNQIDKTTQTIQELQTKQEAMTDKGSTQYTKMTEKIKAAQNKLGDLKDKLEDVGNTKTKQTALQGIGLDPASLRDSNGEMKSVSTILEMINDKTKDMAKGDKAALFTKLFGTTGQQAGIILAGNTDEVKRLTDAADKASKENYVSNLAQENMKTASASLKKIKMAAEAVAGTIGVQFLPALEGVSEKIVRAFDSPAGKKAIENLGQSVKATADEFADWVGNLKEDDLSNIFQGFIEGAGTAIKITAEVIKGVAGLVTFLAKHEDEVKFFSKLVAGIFVIDRVGKFVGAFKQLSAVFGAQTKEVTVVTDAIMAQNKILQENIGLKEASGKASVGSSVASGAGTAVEGAVSGAGGSVVKGVAGAGLKAGIKGALKGAIPLAIISSLIDLIGMNKSNTGEKVGKATGNLGGTLAGAAGGAAIGSVIPGVGTAVGGLVGGIAGSFGGEKIGEKIGKEIQKGLGKTKLKAPSIMSNKKSYDSLTKETKKYYGDREKQQTDDLKLLKKNGTISKEEYDKQIKVIKKNGEDATKFTKLSKKDQASISKYYAQEIAKVEETYAKKRKDTNSKWDKKIAEDTQKFGVNSYQVQKDIKNKEKALDELSAKQKKAVSDKKVKFVQTATVAEAKLHTTLEGKIKLSNSKQVSMLDKLVNEKGKLNKKQLQDAVDTADKAYKSVVEAANKQHDKEVKSANDKYEKVRKAAEKQRDAVQRNAQVQYEEAVRKAQEENAGSSKEAVEKRTKVINEAKKQRDDVKKHAQDEMDGVINHAIDEKNQSINNADTKRDQTTKHAERQKKAIDNAAKEQHKGVVTHSVNEANQAMEAQHKQGKGTASIWSGIADFFNGIGKWFGMSKVSVGPANLPYSQVTMPAIATGGVSAGGRALVGEAGVEAKYSPYSGKIDFLGLNGAEVVNLKAGEHILNANDTAKLFNGGLGTTMKGYASGTTGISGFLSKMMDSASDIWDKVSEGAEKAMEKLTNPVKTLKDIASSAFGNNVPHAGSIPKDLTSGMTDKVVDSVADALNKIKKAFDDNGSAGSPAGSGVQRWKKQVVKALKANGLSTSEAMVNKVLRQINTESGGNEKAMGGTDGLADGRAMGLMQVKPGTFNANRFPGHNNIMNGYDSLLAGLNYAKKRYGSDLSFLGKGHGYANGGIISKHGMYEIGEGNKAEAIIPLDAMRRTRGWELLFNVMSEFAGDGIGDLGTNKRGGQSNEVQELRQQVSDLTNKMDILIDAMTSQVQQINVSVEADKRAIFQGSARYINQELNNNKTQELRLAGKRF
ncbi:phage tail tape measure protein [Jeotgalibaca porci]|uniref:phage tail tape measure protein n=1 Tax=Jeotgalibaca porci TaxID=1868793 RepID=UPI0035A0D475